MKKFNFFVLGIAVILLGSCGLLTFYPIFTPEQLVKQDQIIGTWKTDNESIIFEPATKVPKQLVPETLRPYTSQFYACTQLDGSGDTTNRFLAFIINIANNQFIDLFPIPTQQEASADEFFRQHELKLHTISKIQWDAKNSVLKWVGFTDNYVEELVKTKKLRITHTYVHNIDGDSPEMLITASTKELQQFLEKYGNNKEAFAEKETKTYLKKK